MIHLQIINPESRETDGAEPRVPAVAVTELTLKHMIACGDYTAAAGKGGTDEMHDAGVCVCVCVCVCVVC